MRLSDRGRGKPDGDGTSAGPAKDYARPPVSAGGGAGHLGHLQPLGPEGQRWGCRNAETGETVVIVSKRTTPAGDILTDDAGNLWTPSRLGGVEPYVP